MTCRTILSQVRNRTDNKAAKRGRPILYSYKLSLLLVTIVILTASVSCTLAPTGLPQAPPEQPATPEPAPLSPAEQVPYITAEELLQKIDSGGVLVIDVRLKESYDADHIKGAISIPLSTIGARGFVLPPTNKIVLYCGCPNEESSTKAALELIKQGFSGVEVLKGGYTAWKEKAFPTQRGG